jgi:hypothetical protein
VEGLVDYPELAGRASEILASDMENLRQGLIQIEELKRRSLASPTSSAPATHGPTSRCAMHSQITCVAT